MQTQLSSSDFKKLSQERSDYLNGKVNDTVGALNRSEVSRVVKQNLATLQIPVTGRSVDATRVGGIRQFVDQSVFAAQQGLGRKLTPAEIDQHVSGLFATNVPFRNTLFGFTTSAGATRLMGQQISDMPIGAADSLRKALVQQGNAAPTDTDVLNLYPAFKCSARGPQRPPARPHQLRRWQVPHPQCRAPSRRQAPRRQHSQGR